jgi:hypothetical protein
LDLTKLKARAFDSEDMTALNFLWVDARRLGVAERGRPSVDEFKTEENGRFGVNGAGRVVFLEEDVADDEDDEMDMVKTVFDKLNLCTYVSTVGI